MTTLAEIKTVIESVRVSYEKRIAKVITDNQDVKPTIDVNGRYHAPCDNYLWINDETYLGGEFLPNDEEYVGGSEIIKIKIVVSLEKELDSIIPGRIGKSWNQNGVEMAYFYAVISKAEKTALLKILPEGGKRVALATENTTTKTWKFSSGKFTRRFSNLYGKIANWYDIFEATSYDFAPGVEFKLVTKKDGNMTYKSDFDGKMVCYEYLDNTIYE